MNDIFGYGIHAKPQVRLTRPQDVNTLTHLDLKCYQYPVGLQGWQEFMKGVDSTNRIVLLEVGKEAVGFAAYELVEQVGGESYVNITRLGVQPRDRRKGYGTILLNNIENSARRMKADGLCILVPELHCTPGDPDDVLGFLTNAGFKASGAIEYNCKRMYGEWVDGYYFIRRIL